MRVAVVGAGIVGLCAAYECLRRGASVTVVDRDPAGDKASFGNAGGIAVTEVLPASVPGLWKKVPRWLLDPLGPLALRPAHLPALLPWLWRFAQVGAPAEVGRLSLALAQLNARVFADLEPLYQAVGLANDLHRAGALTVYESEHGLEAERRDWEVRRVLGIESVELSGEAAREMEPALGPLVKAGVFTPQWAHVSDPKKIVDTLRNWLVGQGVQLKRGEVERIETGAAGVRLVLASGPMVADKAVIAAGAWSAALARQLGDRVLLESERGYNTTLPASGVSLSREVIFAERKFVATPLAIGLRIGGAAEFGGLDARPNYARSAALVKLARRYFPDIREEGGKQWSGHRPTTPDSLPVIGASSATADVIYAFGHGHLGLTQGPTTGKLVGDLVFGAAPPIDLAPFSAVRFKH